MDITTANKIFPEAADRKMQRIATREEFLPFWKYLIGQGFKVKGCITSDSPTAWIEDVKGKVLAKWYHEMGTCHEFFVDPATWQDYHPDAGGAGERGIYV